MIGTKPVRTTTVANVRISLPDTAFFRSVRLLCTVLALALLGSTFTYAQSGQFQHVVVIFQENRSTDNLFGSNPSFEPGVDLATSGLNSKGQQIPLGPVPLTSCYDLMHIHSTFLKEYNGGKMNGADKVGVLINPGCQVPTNPQFKYVDNPPARFSHISTLQPSTGGQTGCSRAIREEVSRRTNSFSPEPPHPLRTAIYLLRRIPQRCRANPLAVLGRRDRPSCLSIPAEKRVTRSTPVLNIQP